MATVTERLALLITADGQQAIREMGIVGAATKKNLGNISNETKDMAKQAAVGAAVVGAFLLDSARKASALNEQVQQSNVVFGSAADDIQAFAQTATESFGLSERAALQFANNFATMFKSAGASESDAAAFSATLAKLTADISSFKDRNSGEVAVALRSGLTGELEPLRGLGIIINDNTVKAKALAMGLANASGEVDDGAKVFARLQLILEQTGDAQGDFARTADGMANSQRTLAAEFEDFQATIGAQLAPAMAGLNKQLSGLLDNTSALAEPWGGLIEVIRKAQVVTNPFGHLLGEVKGAWDALSPSAEKAAKATDYAADTTRRLSFVQREATGTTKDLEKSQDDLEKTVLGKAKADESLTSASKGVTSAQRSQQDAQDDLNELLDEGKVNAEDVARAEERLADASEAVTRAQRDEVDTTQDLADAQDAVRVAQQELDKVRRGAGADDIRKAELDIADALDAQKKAALDLAKARDDAGSLEDIGMLDPGERVAAGQDIARSVLDVADATREVERADFRAKDAQAELTRLQNLGKDGSEDLKDAQQKLADAQDEVARRTQAVADAHTNVAKAQDDERQAHDELAKVRDGDPEFDEKVRDARQKVADATEAVATAQLRVRDATREARDATSELLTLLGDVDAIALDNIRAQLEGFIPPELLALLAGQAAKRPGSSAPYRDLPTPLPTQDTRTFVGDRENPLVNRYTVTVHTGADPDAVVRAIQQDAGRNGGSPRR